MSVGALPAARGAIAFVGPRRHERLAAPPASLRRTAALAPQSRLGSIDGLTAPRFAADHDFWQDVIGATDHRTPAVLARPRAMPTVPAAFQGAIAADIFDAP